MKVGEKAPNFNLPNQDGQPISLTDYHGQQSLVVYFYPKDETPGCTKEACSFRDSYEAFKDAGAEVIGISADSIRSHQSFSQNRRLPFQLLSDQDNAVRKSYGVKGAFLGLLPGRETFVIDKEGVVQHHFVSQTQIDKHISAALKIVQELES